MLLFPGILLAEGTNDPPVLNGDPAISETNPGTFANLDVNYFYFDINNDPEDGTIISWHKIGVDSPVVTGTVTPGDQSAKILPSSHTTKEEQWYATVKPCDGTDYGEVYTSNTVTIVNTAPMLVDGVSISPSNPKASDSLSASYTFYDYDEGDIEDGTQVRWYKNSSLQEQYNDSSQLPSDATQKGEEWKVTVEPSDGTDYGSLYTSAAVTIANSKPVAENVAIAPDSPKASDNLSLSYSYNDIDSDEESGTEIRWYMDEELIAELDGMQDVDSCYLEKGQSWQVKVKPGDGEEFGQEVTSGSVNIGNSTPTLSDVGIIPSQPVTGDSLKINYSYNDIDGDSEGGIEICWYKNSEKVEALDGLLTIDPDNTSKDESWHAAIKVSDGTEFSQLYNATSVTIQNSLPEATNVLIQPGSPDSGDTLTVDYSYLDADGDEESGTEIRWYRDGSIIEELDNKRSVNSSYLEEGQSWQVKVKPNDGSSWGTEIASENVEITKKEESPPSNPAPVEVVEESTEENEPGDSTEELPGEQESSKEDPEEDKKEKKDRKDSSQKVEQEAEQPSPEGAGEDGGTGDAGAGNEITEVLNFDNGNLKVKLDNSIQLKVFRRLFNSYSNNIISNVYTIWAEEGKFSNFADRQVGVRVNYNGDFNNPVLAAWDMESERWVEIKGKLVGNFLSVPLGEINGKRICIFDKLFNYYKKYIDHVKSYNLFPAIGDTSLCLYIPSLTFKEDTEIEIERIVIPSNPINKEIFKIEAGTAAGNPVEAFFHYSELNENPTLAYWDKDKNQWIRKHTIKVDDMYIKGEIDRWGLWTILDSK
ncbi:MAG: hypothetical protein R6U35_00520 [Candidatus Humimicrobiaceae bacterium]